jgi:cyclic pyranopterin phosphate synthase
MPQEIFNEGYPFLQRNDLLSYEEIEQLVQCFAGLGAKKIRITGGEPLLRRHLPVLIEKISKIDGVEDTALTTNGLLLGKFVQELKAAGLNRLTVSLDSMDDDTYGVMNGQGIGTHKILEGIESAMEAGFAPIKINVVVQKGTNEAGVLDLVRYFKDRNCIVRFIEYMDVGNCNQWDMSEVTPSAELKSIIESEFSLTPIEAGYRGEVATRFAFEEGAGEIGFISSVTAPFCGDCTRARLSADGKLYTCLFASEGVELKQPLRDGASSEQLMDIIRNAWTARSDRYSELRATQSADGSASNKVEMFHIGG